MHEYFLGKSGTGKSTSLEHHALQNEGGFCFIDKHGQSAEKLADTLPCIYWSPAETTGDIKIGFNPLKGIAKSQRHLVAAGVVSSFKTAFGLSEERAPRLLDILSNTVLLLLDTNGALTDIPVVLTDIDYRTRLLSHLRQALNKNPRDKSLRDRLDYWDKEFEQWDDRYRNEAIAAVLNKVRQLRTNPVLFDAFSNHTISLSRIMDKRLRLVVNLSRMGEAPAFLLGAMLVSAFAHAAEARSAIPEVDRIPFTLYVDEFQNFATDAFATVLSESRKWGLSLVLAHQYLAQVPETILKAVLGNVTKMTVFRVSAEDAAFLAPELGRIDLADTPNFVAWQRDTPHTGGRRIPTFPPAQPQGRLAANRRHTRASYGRV